MRVRMRMTLVALVLLAWTPPLATAVCFDMTGLPEAASLNVGAAPAPPGLVPLVGDAQGICGIGERAAAVQGTAIVGADGSARVGLKFLTERPGCSGGEAEIVINPPYSTGSGQLRLPEGSLANVTLTLDPTGQACQPRVPRPTTCIPNSGMICLLQRRFIVTATAAIGPSVIIRGVAVQNSSESGSFTFGVSQAAEVIVKVLDGRGVNNFYWVMVTPTTAVAYTVTVSDTLNSRIKTFVNPVGAQSSPIIDTVAFSASP